MIYFYFDVMTTHTLNDQCHMPNWRFWGITIMMVHFWEKQKLKPKQEKKSMQKNKFFLNSLSFKLAMLLWLAKHILELGQGHVQSIWGNLWNILQNLWDLQNKNLSAVAPEIVIIIIFNFSVAQINIHNTYDQMHFTITCANPKK